MNADEQHPDLHERVKARAYAIWESEGRPEGKHLDHWLQAEREVLIESSTGSEPSDHLQPTDPSVRISRRSA